jgi:hypothetical protein
MSTPNTKKTRARFDSTESISSNDWEDGVIEEIDISDAVPIYTGNFHNTTHRGCTLHLNKSALLTGY